MFFIGWRKLKIYSFYLVVSELKAVLVNKLFFGYLKQYSCFQKVNMIN